jgi:hypothetical protein
VPGEVKVHTSSDRKRCLLLSLVIANCHAAPIKIYKKTDSAELQVALTKCCRTYFSAMNCRIAGYNTPEYDDP